MKYSGKAQSRLLENVKEGLGLKRKVSVVWEKNFRKDD